MSDQTSTLISLDESKHYHDQFLSKFCYHFHFFIKLDHIHFISINFDQVWPVNHLISLSVFSRCVVSVVLTKQSTLRVCKDWQWCKATSTFLQAFLFSKWTVFCRMITSVHGTTRQTFCGYEKATNTVKSSQKT